MRPALVLGLLLPCLAAVQAFVLVPDGTPLKICSFNIQVFGQTKYAAKDVVNILLKILSRYDIIQVLEIRDSSGTVFEHFRQDLNNYMHAHGSREHFERVESTRLGRTNSKEQYGFLYRPSRVSVTGTYQFHDTHDVFEREPFGVRFHSPSTTVKDFAMIANHIQPSNAAAEMDQLPHAYETFQRHWHLDDMIISGDFNADCRYLSNTAMSHLKFRHDSRFTWLVHDNLDTTVASSDCSYDKFVVAGSSMRSAVIPSSVKVFRFDSAYGLDKTMAARVSDHYPIEMQLRGVCEKGDLRRDAREIKLRDLVY